MNLTEKQKNTVSKAKQDNRDLILIQVSAENYNRLHSCWLGRNTGTFGVCDYISELVDKLLNDGVYQEAEAYALDLVLKGANPSNFGSFIWDFFGKKKDTCLDWYFAEEAKKQIDIYINQKK